MKQKLYSIKNSKDRKDAWINLDKEELMQFLNSNCYFQLGNTRFWKSELFNLEFPTKIYICEQSSWKEKCL